MPRLSIRNAYQPLSYAGADGRTGPIRRLARKLSRKQWIKSFLVALVVFTLLSHTIWPTCPSFIQPPEGAAATTEDSQKEPSHHVDMSDNGHPGSPPGQNPHLSDETPDIGDYYDTVLNGPPTNKFKDNLRNGTRYLTSWTDAGFTNDVMTLANLIYLARMTNRIPILPPLDSSIGGDPIPIPFSSVFDLPGLSKALGFPVLEWQQVKDPDSTEVDVLGCWNIWEVDNFEATGPRWTRNPDRLGLDISYTKAPENVKLIPGFIHDSHSSFWALAPLAFHDMRAKALSHPNLETLPAPHTGISTLPDEQLLCFDYMFYVCSDKPFEYDNPVYPSWDVVQKHFRWTAEVEYIGNEYLRQVLDVPSGADIPPHITIHARHGDFQNWCPSLDRQGCFTSMDAFSVRVAEVQEELRQRKGINVTHVIMTSDEPDEEWWDRVHEMGWLRIDHEKADTIPILGEWYPVLVDAYIQSAGMGFVGTDRSTFSIIAKRRVRDWHDGAVRTVKWGSPDADVH